MGKVIVSLVVSILVIAVLVSAALGAPLGFVGPIYDGPELDYQPAIPASSRPVGS